MKLDNPFPGHYDANDPFGNVRPDGGVHTGSDWPMPGGTPIPAIGSGTVVYVGFNGGTGNCVVVDLGNGMYYAYLHMQSDAIVNVGDHVTRAQILGFVGTTGSTSGGNHLHITISDSPQAYVGQGNKVDPYAYIMANQSSGNIRLVPVGGGAYRFHRVV